MRQINYEMPRPAKFRNIELKPLSKIDKQYFQILAKRKRLRKDEMKAAKASIEFVLWVAVLTLVMYAFALAYFWLT